MLHRKAPVTHARSYDIARTQPGRRARAAGLPSQGMATPPPTRAPPASRRGGSSSSNVGSSLPPPTSPSFSRQPPTPSTTTTATGGRAAVADEARAPAVASPPSPRMDVDVASPVVLVRLPLRRPAARPWRREEEARLTRICQERWPRVDWRAVARELDRDVHDCVSRSTLLHLQELERTSEEGQPPSPPPPSPHGEPSSPSSAAAVVARGMPMPSSSSPPLQQQRQQHGSPQQQRQQLDSSSSSSARVGAVLGSEVAALAERHGFDWAAVGAALGTDPWECWKAYELHSKEQQQHEEQEQRRPAPSSSHAHPLQHPFHDPLGHHHQHHGHASSSAGGGGSGTLFHSASEGFSVHADGGGPAALGFGRTSSADDVAAFLPPTSSSTTSSRSPQQQQQQQQQQHQHPLLPPFDLATGGRGRGNSPTLGPQQQQPQSGAAASSYLHQFPRHSQRAAGGGGSGGGSGAGAGAAGGAGGGGGQLLASFARPPSAGDLGAMLESGLSVAGPGGGLQSTLFLPGQDGLSLSVLESALLDMPSLYLGHSTATVGFGAASTASTFLGGGGGGGGGGGAGGGSTLAASLAAHPLPGLAAGAAAGGGGGANPLPPPPFPPRGQAFTTPDIPDTIQEGGGEGSVTASALHEREEERG